MHSSEQGPDISNRQRSIKALFGRFTLARFELGVRLVDHERNALATNDLAVLMTVFDGFQRINHFHRIILGKITNWTW